MKTVADYIKMVLESEGATNTVSSGAIATKEVPIGKIVKRKDELKESDAYEGINPLANNCGKFPLISGAGFPNPPDDGTLIQRGGETSEDDSKEKKHAFHQKQDHQSYTG